MRPAKLFWTAPAERSGDGAFARTRVIEPYNASGVQSGVALRLPPQSKLPYRQHKDRSADIPIRGFGILELADRNVRAPQIYEHRD